MCIERKLYVFKYTSDVSVLRKFWLKSKIKYDKFILFMLYHYYTAYTYGMSLIVVLIKNFETVNCDTVNEMKNK